MKSPILAVIICGALVFNSKTHAQGVPTVAPGEVAPAEVLKELPKELSKAGTRIFDFQFDPPQGNTIGSNGSLMLKFSYETDAPGKVHVGAMPLSKDQYSGGYQPATLSAAKGSAEVRIICGAPPPTKPITTIEELRASYVSLDTLEIQIYGQPKSELKVRAPIRFSIIPAASFTVQEKFYLDRLLQEVIALRKRVKELEERAK